MGANQSSTVKTFVSSLNENITNEVNNQIQTTEVTNSTIQQVNVQLASIDNCDIIVKQKVVADDRIKAIATFKDTTTVSNKMQAALDSAVKAQQTSVNGFLSLAFANQNSKVNTNESLQNIFMTNITNNNIQALVDFATNLQQGNVQAGSCLNGVIDVSQDAVVNSYVSMMSTTITNALLKNQQIAKEVAKTSVSQSSHNEGIASFFKAWGMVMIGVVIAIILLIILLPKLLGGGSSSQPPGGMPGGEEGGEAAKGGGVESDVVETVEANPELLAAFKFYNNRKLNRFY